MQNVPSDLDKRYSTARFRKKTWIFLLQISFLSNLGLTGTQFRRTYSRIKKLWTLVLIEETQSIVSDEKQFENRENTWKVEPFGDFHPSGFLSPDVNAKYHNETQALRQGVLFQMVMGRLEWLFLEKIDPKYVENLCNFFFFFFTSTNYFSNEPNESQDILFKQYFGAIDHRLRPWRSYPVGNIGDKWFCSPRKFITSYHTPWKFQLVKFPKSRTQKRNWATFTNRLLTIETFVEEIRKESVWKSGKMTTSWTFSFLCFSSFQRWKLPETSFAEHSTHNLLAMRCW